MEDNKKIKLLEEIAESSKKIVKLLEENPKVLGNEFVSTDSSMGEVGQVQSSSELGDWDTFLKSKKTKNAYYIVALAVHYLTEGDKNKNIEKKRLKQFLEEEVLEMNGRDVDQDIGHAVGSYGYVSSVGKGKYKINAATRKIVNTLPNEEPLKNLSKKYQKNKRKSNAKKKTE